MPPALSTPKSVQFFTYDILNVAFKASFAWVVNIQFTFFSASTGKVTVQQIGSYLT